MIFVQCIADSELIKASVILSLLLLRIKAIKRLVIHLMLYVRTCDRQRYLYEKIISIL